MNRLERLRARLAEAEARLNTLRAGLLELAERDGELAGDDAARWTAENAEFDQLRTEIPTIEAEIAQVEQFLDAGQSGAGERSGLTVIRRQPDPLEDEQVQYGPVEQVRGAARTAIERMTDAPDHVRSDLTSMLGRADNRAGSLARHMIAAGRDSYRSAFRKILAGDSWDLTELERRSVAHVRAAGLTDTLGGYAVPTVLDPTLILTGAHDGLTPNPVRELARVRPITGDNLNLTTTSGVTASYSSEAAESVDGAPTFGRLTLSPIRADVMIPFSVEIQGDYAAFESDMRRLMMVAKDDLEISKFVNGVGTTEPLGIVYDLYTNYSGQVQASSTANALVAADVYAVTHKIAERYQTRAGFLANRFIYDVIRQLDTGGGASLWVQLAASTPGTLIGAPARQIASMDGTYGSGENYVLLYGDIAEAYTIVDRVGMSVELIPHLLGATNNLPTGQRGLYAWWRNGAAIVNSEAIGLLNVT